MDSRFVRTMSEGIDSGRSCTRVESNSPARRHCVCTWNNAPEQDVPSNTSSWNRVKDIKLEPGLNVPLEYSTRW